MQASLLPWPMAVTTGPSRSLEVLYFSGLGQNFNGGTGHSQRPV